MKPVIEISQLSKRYYLQMQTPYLSIREEFAKRFKGKQRRKEFWALKDINLDIYEGERIAIVGKNGAGKSTLLKILSKVTYPTRGTVLVYKKLSSLLEVGTGFHPELTGRENIFFNGSILGLKKSEILSQLDAIVDFSGVEEFIDTPLKHYSSGMQMRLAFSVAAFLQPEILIVDEVLSVGDIEFQEKCIGKMQELGKSNGRTLIFVSHNMAALKQLCTSGIILDKGSITHRGSIQSCIDKYLVKPSLVNQSAEVNLATHADKFNANLGLVKARLLINGQPSDLLMPGDSIEIELQMVIESALVDGEIGFVVKDKNNEAIIGLNNKHLGKKLQIRPGVQNAVVSIPNLNLYAPGKYSIDLFLGDYHTFYECLYNAMSFHVSSTDIYKSGILIDPDINKIYLQNINIEMSGTAFKDL